MFTYEGKLGNTKLTYGFRYPETALYFRQFLHFCTLETPDIEVTESDFQWAEHKWNSSKTSYLEYVLSMYRTSDYLTYDNSCLFHGAAFLWNGKAYVISADSGVGKTTQIKNWMELYSHEIRIINGDKPVLHLEKNQSLTVYPSPWKGKEEWGDDSINAPLGGVILLQQGQENIIKRIDSFQFSAILFANFFSTFEKKEVVQKLCQIETSIWQSVPVWLLVNTGDKVRQMMIA